jgi:hypothetical protein
MISTNLHIYRETFVSPFANVISADGSTGQTHAGLALPICGSFGPSVRSRI